MRQEFDNRENYYCLALEKYWERRRSDANHQHFVADTQHTYLLSFHKSIKAVFKVQGAWHSQNTRLTKDQGRRPIPSKGTRYPPSGNAVTVEPYGNRHS
jgi:hypothetical protein